MASTVSANGSTQSLSVDQAIAGHLSREGGMEELLPLVLQLTNAESVSAVFWCCVALRRSLFHHQLSGRFYC